VEEARNAGTYVCAHAYTAAAIKRCLELGVRSIEHGNVLSLKILSQAHVSVVSHICITPQIFSYLNP
jgi:imidazolonepropionase-like amidohydrolase